jgi:hypothetical protein
MSFVILMLLDLESWNIFFWRERNEGKTLTKGRVFMEYVKVVFAKGQWALLEDNFCRKYKV